MSAKSKFTLDGKPFRLARTRNVQRAVPAVLDKLAEGSLLTTRELSRKVGCVDSAILRLSDALEAYSINIGQKRLWGSKRTIRNAGELLGNDN